VTSVNVFDHLPERIYQNHEESDEHIVGCVLDNEMVDLLSRFSQRCAHCLCCPERCLEIRHKQCRSNSLACNITDRQDNSAILEWNDIVIVTSDIKTELDESFDLESGEIRYLTWEQAFLDISGNPDLLFQLPFLQFILQQFEILGNKCRLRGETAEKLQLL